MRPERGPLAQLVEHRTFNPVVGGSSPPRLTILLNDLAPEKSGAFFALRARKRIPAAFTFVIGKNAKTQSPLYRRCRKVIQLKITDVVVVYGSSTEQPCSCQQ